MIDLKLLDLNYLDVALTNETRQYLTLRNNTALASKHSVIGELLHYARRTLYFSMSVTKTLSTVNGKRAYTLLMQKNIALRDEITYRKKEAKTSAPLVDLIKMEEMPCYQTVHGLIVAHRGVMNARYSQLRSIDKPETCILKFGKLLLESGAHALAVSDLILDFAGYPWLKVNSERLLRFDCLTNEELGQAKCERAKDSERLSILADLRNTYTREQQARFQAAECLVMFRSPWDDTHSLGFVMLSYDVLKSKEELAEQVSLCPVLFLEYVAVNNDIKRCGMGTRMVKWAMETALSKGFREIALGADEGALTWEFWHRLTFKHTDSVKAVTAILHA